MFALGALYGILLAVALSLGDLLRRVARPHDGVLGYVPGMAGMHDVDDYPDAEQVPGLVVYRYDSPLFFANAEDFHHRALAAVDEAEHPVEWLLLNVEANVEVDLTSLDALARLHRELDGARRRAGPGAGQAGPPRRPAGGRPRRRDRHRPDVRRRCRPRSRRTSSGTRNSTAVRTRSARCRLRRAPAHAPPPVTPAGS